MLFQPESPRWLAMHRGREAAVVALERIRPSGDSEIEAEINSILESIEEERLLQKEAFTTADLFRSRSLRSMMLLGSGLQAMQQLAGVNTVMYYTGTIVSRRER